MRRLESEEVDSLKPDTLMNMPHGFACSMFNSGVVTTDVEKILEPKFSPKKQPYQVRCVVPVSTLRKIRRLQRERRAW